MTATFQTMSVTGWRTTVSVALAIGFVVAGLTWVGVSMLAPSQVALSAAIAGLAIPASALPWMAAQSAVAKRRLQEARDALDGLKGTDPTTLLPTTSSLLDRAHVMVEAARKENAPLTAVIVDVDHLIGINNRFGRAGGDAVLASVAEFLRLNLQPGVDMVARTGGASFVMLLPQADHAWAVAFAERLRGAVANRPVRYGSDMIAISASFGVAALSPADANAEALLHRAENALRAAKSGGRNKIEVNGAPSAMAA